MSFTFNAAGHRCQGSKSSSGFKKVTYESREHLLLANLYAPTDDLDNTYAGVLIIHGGGIRGKSTFKRLQRRLRNNSIASFAYDASGIGGSEGSRSLGTLNTRLSDAQRSLAVFRNCVKLSRLGLLGMSMGADTVIRLTDTENIDSLTLLAPAAYPSELRDSPLNLGFTRQIRRHRYDWSAESTYSTLQTYPGPILAVYGSNDRIIPEDVQNKYREVLNNGNPQNKFTVIDHANHNFLRPHTDAEAKLRGQAITLITQFIISHLRSSAN